MLAILVKPVLTFMNLLHTVAVLLLTASYHVGRTMVLVLIRTCNIVCDACATLAIIGEELYRFLCELNASIVEVSAYVRYSANGGINCVLEAAGIFLNHIAKFFTNTRLHSKLLATHFGSFIRDILNLLRNALLLIADCTWWLISLLPRWLAYAIITVGDFIVESITTLVCTTQIILEDIFRLTIAIALLFLLWHNRRRLCLQISKWIMKVKQFMISCCLSVMLITRRTFNQRVHQNLNNPMRTLGILKRSPLPRTNSSPSNGGKTLDFSQRCVICTDRQKCVLLLPCKHLCLCEECADHMLLTVRRKNCPLCRTYIDNSLSVYI